MKKIINRRTMLRSTSLGISTVVGLPLLEAMFDSDRAYADAPNNGATPRFFAFYVPNGIIEEKWFPENGTGTTFNLQGTALQAFQDEGLKNEISLYRGMDNPAKNVGGNQHMTAISSWLTGVPIPGDAVQTHRPSIDQEVANALPRTKVASLQLAGNAELDKPNNNRYFNPLKNALNWDMNNRLMPLRSELKTEFDKLYAGSNAVPGAGVDRRTRMKISVLDEVKDERQRLGARLGAGDRQRLDQYYNSLRDLETQLQALANDNGTAGECPKPMTGNIPNPRNGSRTKSIGQHARVAAKITAQAFQCGLTNAITYCAGGEAAGCSYEENPADLNNVRIGVHYHNTISHARAAKYNEWVAVDQFHGKLCANFMKEFKDMPHGTGSLLDGTAILFGSGLGNGTTHDHKKIAMMVGGRFGNWKHGRYHRLNGRDSGDLIDTMRQEMSIPNLGKNKVPIA